MIDSEKMQHSLLSAEQEIELGREIRAGNKAAREKLITHNLRLAMSMARRWKRRGMDFEDLLQEAYHGLILAVDRWDPERGFRFSTYAGWWIRQSIERACSGEHALHIPYHIYVAIMRTLRTSQDLQKQLNRQPTHEEIAATAGFEVAEVAKHFEWAAPVLSLDYEFDNDNTLLHQIDDGVCVEDLVQEAKTAEYLEECISALSPTIQGTLRSWMHGGKFGSEVAREEGVTPQAINVRLQKGKREVYVKLFRRGINGKNHKEFF